MSVNAENAGHPLRLFVDTGANCNTISWKFYETLVAQGLECVFHPGPTEGFNINLVCKQVLHVTGDRFIVQTEVGTSSGNFLSGFGQDFLVLDDDEDMVMGVQWYNSVLRVSPTEHIKILDAKILGLT